MKFVSDPRFVVVVLFTVLCSAKLFIPGEKASAMVEQQQGVYIFILCKPSAEYEYLGSIQQKAAWTGQPSEMLSGMLKKLKKEYPEANGIIFTSLDMDKADCVRFK